MEAPAKHLPDSWFRRYPLVTYYLLTHFISWVGLIFIIGGPDKITSQPSDAPFFPLYLITVAGPFLAGIILTGIYNGKKGYREFLSRLIKCRLSAKWYAAALLIAPVSVFATLFTLTLISDVYMPGIFSDENNPVVTMFGLEGSGKLTLILFVLMLGLFNGFVEEVGWTGFATHELKRKHFPFAGSLGLGIMWGLWHLLSNYIDSAEGAGSVPLPLFIAVLLFSFLPPFRILMVWVYKHTESLFLAVLMHASLDVFWLLSMPVAINGNERVIWYVLWAVVLWGMVGIVGVVSNRRKKKSVVALTGLN